MQQALMPTDLAANHSAPDSAPTPKAAKKKERLRGMKEAGVRVGQLRTRWPASFATDPNHVRPLASSAAHAIADAMGWSLPYTKGVLNAWKDRGAYCRAVLRHDRRLHLDGSLSDETVDDKARQLARARLDQIAARKAKALQRQTEAGADQPGGLSAQPSMSYSSSTVSRTA